MVLGFLIMGFLGYLCMPSLYSLTHSSYNRKGLEEICDEKFGTTNINEALT